VSDGLCRVPLWSALVVSFTAASEPSPNIHQEGTKPPSFTPALGRHPDVDRADQAAYGTGVTWHLSGDGRWPAAGGPLAFLLVLRFEHC
jgi:hypothetical protein